MERVLKQYYFYNNIVDVEPYGGGHINTTYMITTNNTERFILQKINTHVFRKPQQVMENIELVTEFIRKRAFLKDSDTIRCSLRVIPTLDDENQVFVEGGYWRCYKFIEGARTYEMIESPEMFYEVGKAIGRFQRQLKNFPIDRLHITIPDFHNTPKRYQTFEKIAKNDIVKRVKNVAKEIEFVRSRKEDIKIIEDLIVKELIPLRVTHNDTKLNNIMIDEVTKKAVCVIDLDTVMPGSALYDFGDAIRIGASTAEEDETDLTKVKLDLTLFEAFSRGYLEKMHDKLYEEEIEHLVDSTKIITLECGMRFLTDYLDNDQYFKIKYPEHNLIRARTQFKLVEEIENNYENMIQIIDNIILELSS